MTALSIVEEALNGIAAKKGSDALHIVEDALASYEKVGSLVQDEFAFDETPQKTEVDGIAEGDGSEPDDGEGLDLPDGVKVEKEGDDSVKFTFKFKYAPNKYDSTVDDGAKQGDDAEMKSGASEGGTGGEDEQVQVQEDLQVKVAEDALPPPAENAVTHASAQCKATFEECKAKNPYACKYHGQKLMEADLYALLAQNGAKTAKVELTEEKGVKGSFNAVVTCIDTPAEKKAAAKAIKAFLKKQGIDPESVIDFGYDKEDKSHSAFFDVDDLDKGAKSDDEMHKEQKEEPKQEPEEKKEEPSEEKKEESPKEEVKAEAVEETEQTGGDDGKTEEVEEVKETVEGNPEAIEELPELTNGDVYNALQKAFPGQVKFDENDSMVGKWKHVITHGMFPGENGELPLSEVNKGHLKSLVDLLPTDNPVAKVAAATLAKLNAANGEEAAAKPEGGKPKKAKKSKKEAEPQAAETQSQEGATEGGTSGTETDGSAKYAELTDAFNAALTDAQTAGVDTDPSVIDAIAGVNTDLAAVDAADEMIEDCQSALDEVEKDEKMLPSAKDVKKTVMWWALESAKGEHGKSMESLEKSVKELTDKVSAAKAKKEHVAAVEKVKAEFKAVFPHLGNHVTSAAVSKVNKAVEGIKDECDEEGLDGANLVEASGLAMASDKAKSEASAYSSALNEFEAAKGSETPDAEKIAAAAKKVEETGKAAVSAYKKVEEAVTKAKSMMAEQKEANAKAAAAKAASAQAQTQTATPTDKKAAVKAKIAAMTPKEKAAKAIEIVQKKLAADPGNAELQKQLQKFQSLAAKLG